MLKSLNIENIFYIFENVCNSIIAVIHVKPFENLKYLSTKDRSNILWYYKCLWNSASSVKHNSLKIGDFKFILSFRPSQLFRNYVLTLKYVVKFFRLKNTFLIVTVIKIMQTYIGTYRAGGERRSLARPQPLR